MMTGTYIEIIQRLLYVLYVFQCQYTFLYKSYFYPISVRFKVNFAVLILQLPMIHVMISLPMCLRVATHRNNMCWDNNMLSYRIGAAYSQYTTLNKHWNTVFQYIK